MRIAGDTRELLADDSQEISCLIFSKIVKDVAKYVVCCSCDWRFKCYYVCCNSNSLQNSIKFNMEFTINLKITKTNRVIFRNRLDNVENYFSFETFVVGTQ